MMAGNNLTALFLVNVFQFVQRTGTKFKRAHNIFTNKTIKKLII